MCENDFCNDGFVRASGETVEYGNVSFVSVQGGCWEVDVKAGNYTHTILSRRDYTVWRLGDTGFDNGADYVSVNFVCG